MLSGTLGAALVPGDPALVSVRPEPHVRQRSAEPEKSAAEGTCTRRSPRRQASIPYGVTTVASLPLIDKNVLPNLATAPENAKTALYINDKFWLENLDKLNQRFNAWVAK